MTRISDSGSAAAQIGHHAARQKAAGQRLVVDEPKHAMTVRRATSTHFARCAM